MRGFGRILAYLAVHLVQLLGLTVEGLEIVVAERPRRRHAVMVTGLLEVTAPKAWQACPIELGVAADPVVDPGLERLPGRPVEPWLGSGVALADEHVLRLGVLRLPGQEMTPLNHEHVQADILECPSQGPAAHA